MVWIVGLRWWQLGDFPAECTSVTMDAAASLPNDDVDAEQADADDDSGEEMTYGEYLLYSARCGDLEALKECLE